MKIQVTVLVLLVAALAAYEAAPVEGDSPATEGLQRIVNFARTVADSASTLLDNVSNTSAVQSGREWLSSLIKKIPEYIKQKHQDLSQRFLEITHGNNEES